MILTVSGLRISNRNWHVRCCDHFAYYEICNKRVHKRETAMNSGEVMMSNACQVGRGVRKPEASNGAMNMSRYISKSVLLLTLSVVICCGLYTLSPWIIGQGIFPFQANNSVLTGPDSKVVGSRQRAQLFTKDEYFQPRPSTASHDASASTSSAVAASNNIFDQSRDFGAADESIFTAPNAKGLLFLRLLRCRRRLRTSVGKSDHYRRIQQNEKKSSSNSSTGCF